MAFVPLAARLRRHLACADVEVRTRSRPVAVTVRRTVRHGGAATWPRSAASVVPVPVEHSGAERQHSGAARPSAVERYRVATPSWYLALPGTAR